MRVLCGCGCRSSTPCLLLRIWNPQIILDRVSLWVDSFLLLPPFYWHQFFPVLLHFFVLFYISDFILHSLVYKFCILEYLCCVLYIFGEAVCKWVAGPEVGIGNMGSESHQQSENIENNEHQDSRPLYLQKFRLYETTSVYVWPFDLFPSNYYYYF